METPYLGDHHARLLKVDEGECVLLEVILLKVCAV